MIFSSLMSLWTNRKRWEVNIREINNSGRRSEQRFPSFSVAKRIDELSYCYIICI